MLYSIGKVERYNTCYVWDTDDLVLEEISSKDIIKSDLNIVKLPSICDDGYYLYNDIIYCTNYVDKIILVTKDNKLYSIFAYRSSIDIRIRCGFDGKFVSLGDISDVYPLDAIHLLPTHMGVSLVQDIFFKNSLKCYTISLNDILSCNYRNCNYNKLLKGCVLGMQGDIL